MQSLSIVKRLQILENRFISRDRGIGKGVLVRDEEKMGIPCEIPTFTCFVFAVWLCFKSNERRGNRLYLIIFKPHWLLELCSLQSNEVKTKRLINFIGNGINRLNCPIESPERAVTGHLYWAARWIDVLLLHAACLLSWDICLAVMTVRICTIFRQLSDRARPRRRAACACALDYHGL